MHIGHDLDTSYNMSIKGKNWTLENITEEKDLAVHTQLPTLNQVGSVKSAAKTMSVLRIMKRSFGMVAREDF